MSPKLHIHFLRAACLLVAGVSAIAANGQPAQQVVVTNRSSVALRDKAIVIKRSDLKVPEGRLYPLLLSSAHDTIPAQVDDRNGDEKWDELFFVASMAASSKNVYSLRWVRTPPVYEKRTSVRFGKRSSAQSPVQPATSEVLYQKELPKSLGFQRYQTDGPSWENDKVGFRHYLDGRNAKDVFGKLVSYMSPKDVGVNARGEVEDNYHVMAPWGRDILAVGNSAGIGGIALEENGRLFRLGVTVEDSINNVEKTAFRVVAEGPVRSVLNIQYSNWQPAENRNFNVEETTSIWPGMYAYHNSVKVSGLRGREHLGIGMVDINAAKAPTELRIGKDWVVLLSHDKHTYNKEWWLGLALILPAADYVGYMQAPKTGKLSHAYFAQLKVRNNQPVNYYAVAGWELSDAGFSDPIYFENYVKNLVSQLSADVQVEVK